MITPPTDTSQPIETQTLCLAFLDGQVLIREDGAQVEFPSLSTLERSGLVVEVEERFPGPDGILCHAVALTSPAELPPGLAPLGLRTLHSRVPDRIFATLNRASQLLEWNRSHRFCGRCGEPTVASRRERAKECPGCRVLHFPRLNPAVIVSVRRGPEILLGRSPHFQPGVYSVLAGFVEPGESLEETVAREIREEVGIEVGSISYFGSQSWPFPNSLMIAFTAEYAGGELRIDRRELEDAGWFRLDSLPVPPSPPSIARTLLDHFIAEQGGDPKRYSR
jgi:NAD+ diphosphatase